MSRVVFDSNVFISAFVFGGKPRRLWTAALDGEIELVCSPALLTEASRVLGDKFALPDERVREFVIQVVRLADVVEPTETLHVVDDEPDNRVFECAVEGEADLIVTGDAHLLSVKVYDDIEIVTVAEALDRLGIGGDES